MYLLSSITPAGAGWHNCLTISALGWEKIIPGGTKEPGRVDKQLYG